MDTKQTIAALGALAQETRLTIFRLLVQAGPTGISVGDIGAAVTAAPATLSFHLKELTRAGLIEARQDGRFIFYSANYVQMNALLGFLTENCCAGNAAGCAPDCKPATSKSSKASAVRNTQTTARRAKAR